MRDYTEIVERVNALGLAAGELEVIGRVEGHPVHLINLGPVADCTRRILMTSGIHGDEPAGPMAILEFLEKRQQENFPNYQFTIIPCINPIGYINNTRENGSGIDLNRSFDSSSHREIEQVKQVINGNVYDLFIEFHEDWEYTGYYLFELTNNSPQFGPAIIESVKNVGPIHPGPEVDGMPVVDGIVHTGEAEAGTEIMPIYLQAFHTNHCITLESASQLDMGLRIQSHLAAVTTALNRLD